MAWQARVPLLQNYYRDDISELPDLKVVATQLWKQCDLGTDDIDVACFYDAYSPLVLMCLETFGFCDRSESVSYVAEGHIGRGGDLPVNPNGGELGEGYLTDSTESLGGPPNSRMRGKSGDQC